MGLELEAVTSSDCPELVQRGQIAEVLLPVPLEAQCKPLATAQPSGSTPTLSSALSLAFPIFLTSEAIHACLCLLSLTQTSVTEPGGPWRRSEGGTDL